MKNIIIADDSFTVRKVIEMLLKPLGYNLIFADNGDAALRAVKSTAIDAIVLDFSLPDIDSARLSKEIKKYNPNIPVLIMYNGKEHTGDKILSLCECDEIIEKPFDSQSFLSKIENLKSKLTIISDKESELELVDLELEKGEKIKEGVFEESLELDFGEEFSFKEGTKKKEIILDEWEIGELESEDIEEVEELKDIEEIEVEELQIEEATPSETKKEMAETLTLEDLLSEEVVLEEVTEKTEEKKEVEEKEFLVEKKEEETSIDINEFFSDLNEILVEKEKPSVGKVIEEKKVKPVVEEVAKELKEMEEIVPTEEDLDIWDFEVPSEKEVKEAPKVAPIVEQEVKKLDLHAIDRRELENIIKEITYEVIEKVAWEVVPEIVDTILKDKFPKR